MLKIKKGFLLRKLGTEHIAVAIGEASKTFNGMVRLNETGAFYWKELEKGTTPEDLAEKAMEKFEGADKETIRLDIEDFLKTISPVLENDSQND